MSERVQKLMAAAGVASRRASEDLIRQGRVTVNGEPVQLGDRADPEADVIRVDGEAIGADEEPVYLMLNKPSGVLSSTASQGGHRTIDDLVDVPQRVFPVGRLDLDSQGLMLLTNDGELTNRLTHPRYEHEKEYRVQFNRPPRKAELQAWRHGPVVPGLGKLVPAQIVQEPGQARWVRITLREGKKRQIRETAQHFGLEVEQLIRVRIETLPLGNLPAGSWRELEPQEVAALKRAANMAREEA